MKRSAIDLHIDELILRGVPYAQRHFVATTVEQTLLRLLTERGLPPSLAQGGSIPRMNIGQITLSAEADSDAPGEEIAQRIYAQLSSTDFQSGAARSE